MVGIYSCVCVFAMGRIVSKVQLGCACLTALCLVSSVTMSEQQSCASSLAATHHNQFTHRRCLLLVFKRSMHSYWSNKCMSFTGHDELGTCRAYIVISLHVLTTIPVWFICSMLDNLSNTTLLIMNAHTAQARISAASLSQMPCGSSTQASTTIC